MCHSPISGPVASYLTYTPETNEERLLLASAKGELETVEQMVDAGVDIATPDTNGKIARLFLKGFAALIAPSRNTPLHFACWRNQEKVAKFLLDRAKRDNCKIMYSENSNRNIPFKTAISSNSEQCVDLLLESGLDVRQFPPVDESVRGWCEFPSIGGDFLDPCIEMNPFIYAIRRTHTQDVEKMLCSLGREDAERRIKVALLPFLLSDLTAIVASYSTNIGNSGDFLNNVKNFNVLPLKLAKYALDKLPSWSYQKPEAEKIIALLKEAGAKLEESSSQEVVENASAELDGPPAKKRKIS